MSRLHSRAESLQGLQDQPECDVVVIGGGATGLGCALDAVTRGHSVVLVEAGDFARGTSSRSTKLIHGGVRYLAQGRIHLVREALEERARLLRNAPGLVKPLRLVVPAHSGFERLKLSVGLTLYDWLAGQDRIQPCTVLGRDAVKQMMPALEADAFAGGVAFWDAQFDDTGLAMALLRAIVAHGGRAFNYLQVRSLVSEGGRVTGVLAEDRETGTCFGIKASVLINATGVWCDEVLQMETPGLKSLIKPSQGIHLVVDRSFLPGTDGLLVPQTRDGRLLFVLPWQGQVLMGTTDTQREDTPFEPQPLPGEVDFILDAAAAYLSRAPGRQDVKSVFCGLRPLVASGKALSTSALSREHQIRRSAGGVYSITGGKWTTYRRMAEDMLNRVEADGVLPPAACQTRDLSLIRELPSAGQSSHGLHGSDLIRAHFQGDERLLPEVGGLLLPSEAQVCHYVHVEQARQLEDVLSRRHRTLLLDAEVAILAAPVVASIMARELGWTSSQTADQLRAFSQLAAGMSLSV